MSGISSIDMIFNEEEAQVELVLDGEQVELETIHIQLEYDPKLKDLLEQHPGGVDSQGNITLPEAIEGQWTIRVIAASKEERHGQ